MGDYVLIDEAVRFKKKGTGFLEKFSLCLLISTIVLLLLAIIFLVLYVDRDKKVDSLTKERDDAKATSSLAKKEYKMYTSQHVEVAARLLSSMDPTVDPCTDFYQYACGGWLKKAVIPEGQFQYNSYQKLLDSNTVALNQILKQLKGNTSVTPLLRGASIVYEACMNVSEIEAVGDIALKETIQNLGSWLVTDPDFNSSSWNFTKVLVDYHKTMNSAFLFRVSIVTDLKNSTKNAITFGQATGREAITKKVATLKWMNAIAREIGANDSTLGYLGKVQEFEKAIDEISLSLAEFKSKMKEYYESMTLKEFASKTEIPLDWLVHFLDMLLEGTGHKVQETEIIVSYSTNYIKQAYKMFLTLTPEVQASYAIWKAIKVMIPYLSGNYEKYYYDYQSAVYGQTIEPPTRWKTCVTRTSQIYSFVLSKPFVQRVFDASARTTSLEMVHGIKSVFKENLNSMIWMDDKTRNYAKQKASKMTESIGYPDYIFDNKALERLYGSFVARPGQYFMNCIEAQKFLSKTTFAEFGKAVDKTLWKLPPTTLNAYYDFQDNRIVFPAGILQPPFYDKRAPRAVNYGAIGMVVGHEITHGFDTTGKDYGYKGNLNAWWTKASLDQFAQKSQCFVKQYNNFKLFGFQVNGNLTIGENIADNGALRQSYEAYKHWVDANGEEEKLPGLDLTPDQLYFLAFGQTWCAASTRTSANIQVLTDNHSPNEYRVKGAIQNSEEFSKVFNCPVGSPMNPAEKCRLW